jgi:hypothetical protein
VVRSREHRGVDARGRIPVAERVDVGPDGRAGELVDGLVFCQSRLEDRGVEARPEVDNLRPTPAGDACPGVDGPTDIPSLQVRPVVLR